MKVIILDQGTPEWLLWRHLGIGGSDAPSILGLSPYKTERDLWLEKTNPEFPYQEKVQNFLFDKGHRIEEVIRRDFEEQTGIPLEPLCCEHPDYPFLRASLDGFSAVAGVLEAKYVGGEILSRVMEGEIPPHHLCQMQHQFFVSGISGGIYFCHDGKETGVSLEVNADPVFQEMLLEKEKIFWERVNLKQEPPLSPKDALILQEGDKGLPLFLEYASLHKERERLDREMESIKKTLVSFYAHPKVVYKNISLTRVKRKGSINYGKIPLLESLSLDEIEKYRGPESESVQITVKKEKTQEARDE